MKIVKKPLTLVSLSITAFLFLSWNYFTGPDTTTNSPTPDPGAVTNEEMLAFAADNGDYPLLNQPPAAEDVLIQKIPGDKNHLLLMAYYSRENYAGESVSLVNGFPVTLKDNGKGDDKEANDGLYTAKIPADLEEFRSMAKALALQMKQSHFRPIKFIHREMVLDPDASETFDIKGFEANEPVSVSGLTRALASFDLPSPFQNSEAARSAQPTNTTQSAKQSGAALLALLKQNSVLITNLAVVEDSTRTWNVCTQTGNVNGPWTFGTLMRQLASKNPQEIATDADVSTYVKNWLATWTSTQIVNGDTVAARSLINTQILNPWLTKSQNAGAPAGQLDMRFAPFKLTAIINRFDLRNGMKHGIPGSPCGEGRFVFCLIKSDCSASQQMTIIFEFGIAKPGTCEGQHAWAQQWFNLKNFTLGSSEYNQALQNITDQFTLCGTDSARPNQSSLDQLRTNEIVLSPSPRRWEFREFSLDINGNLQQTTVGQTPADKYDAKVKNADVQRMVKYVNKNKKPIKAGKHIVPATFDGFPFLGGSSHVTAAATGTPPNVFYWDGTDSSNKPTFITDNDARSNFSLETCNGCHGGESQTNFTHVDPAFFGTEAGLSGFLTGTAGSGNAIDFDNDSANGLMTIKDPALRPSATNPKMRTFNDINARANGLKSFLSTSCGSVLGISSQLMFQPTNMEH